MSIFERIKRWWHSDIHARFDNLEKRAMIFRRPVPEKAKREPRNFDYENR